MAIKKYRCRINYLHGCEFFDVIVKANSERKARIRAKDKVIKERGNHFCIVCGCEEIKEESKMAKSTVDLTSKSRVLPDGRKFPKTPEPQIIKENFGSVEVVNSHKRK